MRTLRLMPVARRALTPLLIVFLYRVSNILRESRFAEQLRVLAIQKNGSR